MITDRLEQIKTSLLVGGQSLSSDETALLNIIEQMNILEAEISEAFNSADKDNRVAIIITPPGKLCGVCGRTLKKNNETSVSSASIEDKVTS